MKLNKHDPIIAIAGFSSLLATSACLAPKYDVANESENATGSRNSVSTGGHSGGTGSLGGRPSTVAGGTQQAGGQTIAAGGSLGSDTSNAGGTTSSNVGTTDSGGINAFGGASNGGTSLSASGVASSGGTLAALTNAGGTMPMAGGASEGGAGGTVSSSVGSVVTGGASTMSLTTGGTINTGGMINDGGESNSGSTTQATGGQPPTGGASAMGGTISTGGMTNDSGENNSGGTTQATGGQPPTGGVSATGGTISTGGATSGICPDGTWGPNCANCVVYVSGATGFDTNDGKSWQRPLATIQAAVNAAQARVTAESLTSCDVWVAAGVYTSSTDYITRSAVPMYGGFAGNEVTRDQRNWRSQITNIDGRVTNATTTAQTQVLLDGFQITSSVAPQIGTLIVANCRFSDGGGIALAHDAKLFLSGSEFSSGSYGISSVGNCTIEMSGTYFHNGTAAISGDTTLTASGCTFSDVSVTIPTGHATFDTCTFLGTAAISIREGSVSIINSKFDVSSAHAVTGCGAPWCSRSDTGCTYGIL